ncbi:hypothetical protein CK203_027428 [Vitis vinifera]|uniref:Reverse transcriptase Ty1/copia-type domain-containing protein n=1 Tax=Vitis vinifera TaxID=29760 RepID=A0A438JB63_VITVI|nr:hypothetical protein CK203_027428 [Vitis vinifera]
MGNYEFANRQNESGLQMGVYHKVQTRWKHRKVDHTLFYKRSKEGKVAILIVYVDDMILTSDDIDKLERLKKRIAKNFDQGLGTYVLDPLGETGLLGCKAETPIEPNLKSQSAKLEDFMHSPRPEHFDVVYKILRYLKRALGKGYHLENVATYKLKSILMQIGWEISWIEDQHQVIEPLLEGICEVMWIKRILEELKVPSSSPMKA